MRLWRCDPPSRALLGPRNGAGPCLGLGEPKCQLGYPWWQLPVTAHHYVVQRAEGAPVLGHVPRTPVPQFSWGGHRNIQVCGCDHPTSPALEAGSAVSATSWGQCFPIFSQWGRPGHSQHWSPRSHLWDNIFTNDSNAPCFGAQPKTHGFPSDSKTRSLEHQGHLRPKALGLAHCHWLRAIKNSSATKFPNA